VKNLTTAEIARLQLKVDGYNDQDKKKGRLTWNAQFNCYSAPVLTYRHMVEIIAKGLECYYCGKTCLILPTKYKDGKQLTLDRLDNNKTHEKSNCRVACWCCNEVRSNKYTASEFKRKRK
jgi:hypothetical protein